MCLVDRGYSEWEVGDRVSSISYACLGRDFSRLKRRYWNFSTGNDFENGLK
jgi:hypothetical protein